MESILWSSSDYRCIQSNSFNPYNNPVRGMTVSISQVRKDSSKRKPTVQDHTAARWSGDSNLGLTPKPKLLLIIEK